MPVRHPKSSSGYRTDDEVRYVLRPHIGGAEADVRYRVPKPGLSYLPAETVKETRRGHAVNDFRFGNEHVSTLVSMIAPVEAPAIAIDVVDYMWENRDAD